MRRTLPLLLTALAALAGCDDVENPDHDHDHDHEHGLITAVELTFSPQGGGDASTFTWDEDGDKDEIVLAAGAAYDLSVAFLNSEEDPVEDVTGEIEEDAEAHQVFWLGSGVEDGLVSYSYEDADANGLPLGLDNVMSADAAGSGDLRVVLRHMPEEDGSAVKVEGLAEVVAADGFGGVGGDSDVDATFSLTVQ